MAHRQSDWEAHRLPVFGCVIIFLFIVFDMGFIFFALTAAPTVAIQNRVFHESQAYNDGMVGRLRDYMLDYYRASNDQPTREVLRGTILAEYRAYDPARLPADLAAFLSEIEQSVAGPAPVIAPGTQATPFQAIPSQQNGQF